MNLNPRERFLAIITAVAALVGLVVSFMPEDFDPASLSMISGGELARERDRFREAAEVLKRGRQIREEYARFGIMAIDTDGQAEALTPATLFSNKLTRMLTQQFNIPMPDLSTPIYREIENVPDYAFVELDLSLDAPALPELVRLLRQLEANGLLIQEFRLDKQGGPTSRRSIDMNVTVAALVKRTDQIESMLRIDSGF